MEIKFLKNWKWYEVVFLVLSSATILTCFFVGADKNYLSLSTSLVGVLAVLCVAKGLVIAPYISVVQGTMYSILAYTQGYYGELIVYMLFTVPLNIIAIITWFKNRKKENSTEVEINKIQSKEYIIFFVAIVITSVLFYFILDALHTNQVAISTLSLMTLVAAQYLLMRRSSFYAVGFILNDFIEITLWSIVVFNNGIAYLPTVICFCVFLINDIYGLIRWQIESRKQKQKVNLGENNG